MDNKFTYTLDKKPKSGFFVTMETFGVPDTPEGQVMTGPYGVFSSSSVKQPGKAEMEGGSIFRWSRKEWEELESGKSSDAGIFVAIGE